MATQQPPTFLPSDGSITLKTLSLRTQVDRPVETFYGGKLGLALLPGDWTAGLTLDTQVQQLNGKWGSTARLSCDFVSACGTQLSSTSPTEPLPGGQPNFVRTAVRYRWTLTPVAQPKSDRWDFLHLVWYVGEFDGSLTYLCSDQPDRQLSGQSELWLAPTDGQSGQPISSPWYSCPMPSDPTDGNPRYAAIRLIWPAWGLCAIPSYDPGSENINGWTGIMYGQQPQDLGGGLMPGAMTEAEPWCVTETPAGNWYGTNAVPHPGH